MKFNQSHIIQKKRSSWTNQLSAYFKLLTLIYLQQSALSPVWNLLGQPQRELSDLSLFLTQFQNGKCFVLIEDCELARGVRVIQHTKSLFRNDFPIEWCKNQEKNRNLNPKFFKTKSKVFRKSLYTKFKLWLDSEDEIFNAKYSIIKDAEFYLLSISKNRIKIADTEKEL